MNNKYLSCGIVVYLYLHKKVNIFFYVGLLYIIMAVKSIKKAFYNKSTYKTPKKNKYTKKGAGIKYVGREVISESEGKRQIEFKPVINEIMNLMSNEKSRMNILSLNSFIVLIGFLI